MGLFSKTKTYVSTSAMHLVDASSTPTKDVVITAILKEEKLAETLIKSLLVGMGNKIRVAHKYAKEKYYLGLPEGATLTQDPINNEELVGYIANETGYPYSLLIEEQGLSQYTPFTVAYEFLLNSRGFDQDTSRISIWPEDLNFNNIEVLIQWQAYATYDVSGFNQKVELSEVRISEDNLSIEIEYFLYIERTYIERDREGSFMFSEERWYHHGTYVESISIPEGNTLWNDGCITAIYRKVDEYGNILPYKHIWIYRFKDGTYPELHPEQNAIADEFMPVIPLRYDNIDFTDASLKNNPPDPTNLYSTSEKLLKRLGMSFTELGKSINENPDIDEIDHAYIMWGIDLQTDFSPSLFYLTEFFDNLYLIQNTNESTFLNGLADPNFDSEQLVSNYFFNKTILDSYTTSDGYVKALDEHGLVLYIKHDYITSELTIGTIGTGKVGYAEKSIETYSVEVAKTVEIWEGEYETRYETQHRKKLVLRAQVLPDQFKTVSVHNLQMMNNVYKNKSVFTSLSDVMDDPDNHNFIIPIQYNLADKYTLTEKNVLYADSTLLVINAIEKVKLKWYETGFFKFIVTVAAAVITVYTGQAWLAAAAAAVEAGAATLLVFLAETILVATAIDMTVDWIVTEFGEKIGVIGMIAVVVIATIVGGTLRIGSNSNFMMATGQYMLQGSTALISSVNEFLVEEAQKIYNEYAAFTEELDGLYEELEIAQDLLENKSNIDPLIFRQPAHFKIVPNESPSQFYTRCLGLSDNTIFTIHDQIPNFIDQQLKLDKNITPNMYSMNNLYS